MDPLKQLADEAAEHLAQEVESHGADCPCEMCRLSKSLLSAYILA